MTCASVSSPGNDAGPVADQPSTPVLWSLTRHYGSGVTRAAIPRHIQVQPLQGPAPHRAAGLTITLAAAHLKLSTNTVGRWFAETGRRTQPKIGNCRRLAILLKCKMEDLTEREGRRR